MITNVHFMANAYPNSYQNQSVKKNANTHSASGVSFTSNEFLLLSEASQKLVVSTGKKLSEAYKYLKKPVNVGGLELEIPMYFEPTLRAIAKDGTEIKIKPISEQSAFAMTLNNKANNLKEDMTLFYDNYGYASEKGAFSYGSNRGFSTDPQQKHIVEAFVKKYLPEITEKEIPMVTD